LSRYEDEPDFIYKIVTQYETWVHAKKQHTVEAPWLIPSEEIQEGAISREDDGFIFLGDSQGMIMIDHLEQGIINGTFYADELRRLRQEIARKRRRKLTQGVLLLHDNAPAHTSQLQLTAALKFFPILYILRTWSPLTSSCFRN
jgi:hypothetical protein